MFREGCESFLLVHSQREREREDKNIVILMQTCEVCEEWNIETWYLQSADLRITGADPRVVQMVQSNPQNDM